MDIHQGRLSQVQGLLQSRPNRLRIVYPEPLDTETLGNSRTIKGQFKIHPGELTLSIFEPQGGVVVVEQKMFQDAIAVIVADDKGHRQVILCGRPQALNAVHGRAVSYDAYDGTVGSCQLNPEGSAD